MGALIETPAWRELLRHREELKGASLRDLVLADPQRLSHCEIALKGVRFNYALNCVTAKTIELLGKLAVQERLEEQRVRMFSGEKINTSENRAVLHTALRSNRAEPLMLDGKNIVKDISVVREHMEKFASEIRSGKWLGATGKPIRYVVNIGIGGSDLGPRLAVKALSPHANGPKVYFVANADAYEFLKLAKNLDPAETLFVVVSKTFTTEETLLNAHSARQWLVEKLGEKAIAKHFAAVTSNVKEVATFGIGPENIFPMGDYVGGRFSLWSSVGLSAMIALGPENFRATCDGAFAMDEHFRLAPLTQNMPVVFGLLGVWQRNFLGVRALAILPYSERLRDFPRYIQQLEMESNGKNATREGKKVEYETAPIIFGDCGTVGQHGFHQWLHQGSDIAAADFICVVEDDLGRPEHYKALLANMAAQATALAFGNPQKGYEGNRPSNLLLLDRLDPYGLGLLIALYEHKIFIEGAIWGLNSFDQPGVELGKQLARGLAQATPPRDKEDAFLTDLFHSFSVTTKK